MSWYIMTMTCNDCEAPHRAMWHKMWMEKSIWARLPTPWRNRYPHKFSLCQFLLWRCLLPGDDKEDPVVEKTFKGNLEEQLDIAWWYEEKRYSKQRNQSVQMSKHKISQALVYVPLKAQECHISSGTIPLHRNEELWESGPVCSCCHSSAGRKLATRQILSYFPVRSSLVSPLPPWSYEISL